MKKHAMRLFIFLFITAAVSFCFGAEDSTTISFLTVGNDGKLVYGSDPAGNRIPDFSCCGYMGADHPIPDVPIRVVMSPAEGDNTKRIQTALDYAASLPMDSTGFRGAVLLKRGKYPISGGLTITSSGVVLRGEGMGGEDTILIAAGRDRRTLIRIAGKNDRDWLPEDPRQITDAVVPVGAVSFHLNSTEGLKAGDSVVITRPSTQAWIDRLGMDRFGGGLRGYFAWKPGSRDLAWDRVIRSIDGNQVTVDAPITAAIDASLGGGVVRRYTWPGRIHHVGVENLRCSSEFDPGNQKDENHSWMAMTLENADNAWIRRVTAEHFAGSLAAIWETCKRITVEDCLSLSPVSEEGGYRRHPFFTMGQMTLFLRCWSENGRHDFSVGCCAAGPNAFVQCHSHGSLDDSGPIESLACGTLYDNVRIDGNALRLGNRGSRGEGIGWAAVNSVLWQCDAAIIECDKPPTAWNWAIGCWGEFEGKGFWEESDSFVNPYSLYVAQLVQRLGSDAEKRVPLMEIGGSSTSSPSVELAAEMTAASEQSALELPGYIRQLNERYPINTNSDDAKTFEEIKANSSGSSEKSDAEKRIRLKNGLLVCGDQLLAGGSTGVTWWRGNIRPDIAPTFGIGVTRFVPGRIGQGYTDDLEELTDTMAASGTAVLDHNYGLWYDRRRDDHERVRRMNGNVRPPLYEQPFARSGTGIAWDGLSKYDLTRYNPWYWGRLREFADLCDQKGLVLLHQNYFQHNILEAGAHWADFPWRPANNINRTGFPEPPPYAGNKRIFMDEQFYDISHPVRQPLHRAYIRKCLDNFVDNSNVIQLTSAEYTGPLEFVQFWLDTIFEWKQETGQNPLIGLSCTKDVQDVILADPKRSETVSVIDIRYWWYQGNGTLYAPEGGQHLAPRQHARLLHPRPTSFAQVVRAVREYRSQYPEKAVIYSADSRYGWAVLLGGGSLPNLPASADRDLLRAVSRMKIFDLPDADKDCYALAEEGKQYLIYASAGGTVRLDLRDTEGTFAVGKVDLDTGKAESGGGDVDGGKIAEITVEDAPCLLWITKQ